MRNTCSKGSLCACMKIWTINGMEVLDVEPTMKAFLPTPLSFP